MAWQWQKPFAWRSLYDFWRPKVTKSHWSRISLSFVKKCLFDITSNFQQYMNSPPIWTLVTKNNWKNWSFQKMSITKNVPLNWISSMNFFFWKLQFLKHVKQFLLKLCPFFVSWFWSFGKKYENDLRVIFDQWPKLSLGLDMRPEIPILKVI
jgi:hypothetical protein